MSLKALLDKAQDRVLECSDEMDAIGAVAEAENRDISSAEKETLDALGKESSELLEKIPQYQAALEAKNKMVAFRNQPRFGDSPDDLTASKPANALTTIPATAIAHKSKFFENTRDCYAMGMWLGGIAGRGDCRQWCQHNGIDFRNDMEGGTPSLGGYTVPTPLAATLIRLVESFGVYRTYARQAIMTSNTLDVPKYADGPTVYYPAEGAAITTSDVTFAQVNLVAKKYATLTLMSTELNEDSVISMTDNVAIDIARKMATAEDTNSFLGDGTGTFGGITGIANALLASSTITAAAGLLTGIAMSDFNTMVGKLPQYQGLMPRWYMHSYVYYTVVQPLLQALGGTDQRQVEEGAGGMLLGYPVTFTQVLPGSGAANGDTVAVFGDLDLGAYSGQRRQLSVRVLSELYAATDQIGIQSTMRADSVIHSVGTSTASDPAGALVQLKIQT